MPKIETVYYLDDERSCPLLDWFDDLQDKAKIKCIVRIECLAEKDHELRRPLADYLRDDIYELRVALQHLQYRMLYFFHEGKAIISHGCTKNDEKRFDKEIKIAIKHRNKYIKDPYKHTYRE